MSQYYLYQAPLPKQMISFPITLIDGTKSMQREYTSIIQIYEQIFNDFGETERQQFQFTKGLNRLLPFIASDFGDLTQSIGEMLYNLSQIDYPQYLTIILITDGVEPLNNEPLQNLMQEVKAKYFIQFITILITEQPQIITTITQLNMIFQQDDSNFKSQYTIKRSQRKSILQIQNEFREVFSQIKCQLVVYQQKNLINHKVKTIINQQELSDEVTPGCLFLAEKNQEIRTENAILQYTTSISHILQILQKSFINVLNKLTETQIEQFTVECSEILRVINDLISQSNHDNDNSEEYQSVQLIIQIIKLIISESCNFQQISGRVYEDLVAAIQSAKINQLKEISLINKSESIIEKINQINQKMILSFQNIQRNQNEQFNQLDLLKQQNQIIIETLQQYTGFFFSEIKNVRDQRDHLNNFIILLNNYFKSIYLEKKINLKDVNQVQQLFRLSNIVKCLQQIQTQCSNEQILNSIKQLIRLEENFNNNPKEQVFNYYNSINELIQLKQFANNNNEQDDRESFFVLLINMNESMTIDRKSLQQSYQDGFKDIQNNRRIEIGWNDRNDQIDQEFYLLNQSNDKFNSLVELFERQQEQFQLDQKQIKLCILTDDDQNYWKLHLQIKMLELTNQNVRLIYIALGLGFLIFISNEIEQYAKQFISIQKPYLFNIPKSRYKKKGQQVDGDKFQSKIFEEIGKKFKQNKL